MPDGEYAFMHFRNADSILLVDGDMIFSPANMSRTRPLSKAANASRSTISSRWDNMRVPYFIGSSYPTAYRYQIENAIAHWEANTRIDFYPYSGQNDYIDFENSDGCSSPVGRQGGKQIIYISAAGCGTGNIIHEIGHSLGFFHEQSRTDRDNYVNINWNNIQSGMGSNFDYYTSTYTGINYGPYDFGSIMHYGSYDFAINSGIPVMTKKDGSTFSAQRDGLSYWDKAGANLMYSGKFLANENWTNHIYKGDYGLYFADVTGDGLADAIVVNTDKVTVRRSTGSSFSGNESWTSNRYVGSYGTYFADVTGDGKADAIVVNSGDVTVRRSNGSSFSPNETWAGTYLGTYGNFFADVTGDGKADAIVVNDGGITVRRSTGSGFGPNESWTGGRYVGTHGTFFADVDGDGKADAIAVNDDGIYVNRSSGSYFGGNEKWTEKAFIADIKQAFVDVNGDGKADAIVFNNDGVYVRASDGNGFPYGAIWIEVPYLSSYGTNVADVTGDKKADALVSIDAGVIVRRSY